MLRNTIAIVITLLYPFAVYYGQGKFQPRLMVLLLAAVALVRFGNAKGLVGRGWLFAAGILVVAVVVSNNALPLKLYPVLVNAGMLALFAWSLHAPPTVIERIARMRHAELPPAAIAYTRRVTQVWCAFFVVNGLVALYTALRASDAVWSLYNGLIAYALMGLLFAGEYVVRARVMRAHHA